MKNTDKEKEDNLPKPLEITSPRTAEHPGPDKPKTGLLYEVPVADDDCCSVDAKPKPTEDDHSHEGEGTSFIPTIVSLVLLLSGIAFDYFDVSWFKGYLRLAVFVAAYLLVGGKVLWHAITNIRNGNVFNEFFLMGIATLGAFYIG